MDGRVVSGVAARPGPWRAQPHCLLVGPNTERADSEEHLNVRLNSTVAGLLPRRWDHPFPSASLRTRVLPKVSLT